MIECITKCLYGSCRNTSKDKTICHICGVCTTCARHELCETGVLSWAIRKRVLAALDRHASDDPHYAACRTILLEANNPLPQIDRLSIEHESSSYVLAQNIIAACINLRPLSYIVVPDEPEQDGHHYMHILPARSARRMKCQVHTLNREMQLHLATKLPTSLLVDPGEVGLAFLDVMEDWRAGQIDPEHAQYCLQLAMLQLSSYNFVVARPHAADPNHFDVLVRERADLMYTQTFACVRCGREPALSWRFPICAQCGHTLQDGIAIQEHNVCVSFINSYLPASVAEQDLVPGYVQLRCGCQRLQDYGVEARMLRMACIQLACPCHGLQEIIKVCE